MLPDLILWSHALAALLFGMLAIWAVRSRELPRAIRASFAAALVLTALWALSVSGIGNAEPATVVVEGLRNLAWLAVMLAIHRWGGARYLTLPIAYAVVALVIGLQVVLQLLATGPGPEAVAASLMRAALLMRALSAAGGLVLLYGLTTGLGRSGLRLAMTAIGALWLIDVNLSALRYLTGEAPGEFQAMRGLALALLAGVIALAFHRSGGRELRVSRTATLRSLSVLSLVGYVLVMIAGNAALASLGGRHARVLQTAFVFGSTAALLTLMSSTWLRAWVRVKLTKHLFQHRYDYRVEWARFTETLGRPQGGAPLAERVVKAIADLTQSPAGMLLTAGEEGLERTAGWNWPVEGPTPEPAAALARHLAESGRVLELDAVRSGRAERMDAEATPAWMLDLPSAWVVVPLPHLGQLVGAILVARPPVDRALDWEDFDLLKIAGRQVASYLAEARATEALLEAQRFDEFNRRFAFILHDLKNLVSQLSLVARNAERHADNPEFRADMVATLQESAARMNDLLARLAQRQPAAAGTPRPLDLVALAHGIADARRAQHALAVEAEEPVRAVADAARLEQLLGHLVQNAVEASAPDTPVTLRVRHAEDMAAIEVIDCGQGMSPAFVRERLFKPFVSSKAGGFGIGAFEASQLAQAMGGRVEVTSREGQGSTFRVLLPRAPQSTMEEAA
ncbi:XrtA/PEP-CTERM system histidine kinase PrsK [Sphingomonas desiccabilis]|uniref:XrtA/PEP-CTERM system histidine kinase PrsK n=1 Tax=Sphingomonas desiccabilis TaxID=429134 RepID=UPI00161CBFB5|nr:XrtA/PEP-CTERM system histidine kinase PrsK [Sphingomonas desiccabilis]MBB3912273.1 putative PEP-CTERM system histidine kinase [Sphingomonas desiccabilis]